MRYIISKPLTRGAPYLRKAALASPLALALTCGAGIAQVPQVVTDVPPVHALVASVMGELGQPVLLLEPGASEHHFQLRPSQASALAAADLVVLIGPELTPWIEKPLALRPDGAAVLGLLAAEGTYRQDYGRENGQPAHAHGEEEHEHHDHQDHALHDHGHDHDHMAEHDNHSHESHSEAGHSHDGLDPHAWLDPENGRLWLGLIATELSRLDPENAAVYAANAETARIGIARADATAQALLAPVADRPFVTFHDAYGYFTAHYGLRPAGAISPGDASTPGARHLTELREKVASGEVTCLFPEAGQDPALATRLAEDTGVRVGAALDPVGTLLEPGPDLYIRLLETTAQSLSDCLSAPN